MDILFTNCTGRVCTRVAGTKDISIYELQCCLKPRARYVLHLWWMREKQGEKKKKEPRRANQKERTIEDKFVLKRCGVARKSQLVSCDSPRITTSSSCGDRGGKERLSISYCRPVRGGKKRGGKKETDIIRQPCSPVRMDSI